MFSNKQPELKRREEEMKRRREKKRRREERRKEEKSNKRTQDTMPESSVGPDPSSPQPIPPALPVNEANRAETRSTCSDGVKPANSRAPAAARRAGGRLWSRRHERTLRSRLCAHAAETEASHPPSWRPLELSSTETGGSLRRSELSRSD